MKISSRSRPLLKPFVPTEAQVLASVLQALRHDKRVAWAGRFNSGAFVLGEKQRRYFRANDLPGCPDILGQLRDGRLLAVEIKRPGWTKPKDAHERAQEAFLERVATYGGVSGFIRSLDEIWGLLDGV